MRYGRKSPRTRLHEARGGVTPRRNSAAAANSSTADGASAGSRGGMESATVATQCWARHNCGDKSAQARQTYTVEGYGVGLPCLGGAPCPRRGNRRWRPLAFGSGSIHGRNGKQSLLLRSKNASEEVGGTREGEGNLTPQPPQQKKTPRASGVAERFPATDVSIIDGPARASACQGCRIYSKDLPLPWNAKGIRRNTDGF